jgi:hypothetical protein
MLVLYTLFACVSSASAESGSCGVTIFGGKYSFQYNLDNLTGRGTFEIVPSYLDPPPRPNGRLVASGVSLNDNSTLLSHGIEQGSLVSRINFLLGSSHNCLPNGWRAIAEDAHFDIYSTEEGQNQIGRNESFLTRAVGSANRTSGDVPDSVDLEN